MSQAKTAQVKWKKSRGNGTRISPDVLRQRFRRRSKQPEDLPQPLVKRASGQSMGQRTSPAGDGFTATERALPELKKRGLKLRATVLTYSEGLRLTTDPLMLDEDGSGVEAPSPITTAKG